MTFLLLSACLVDWDTYYQRKDLLSDDDKDGFSEQDGDCDDNNVAVFPGADEYCNGIDDDCDGEADIGAVDAGGWFPDEDGDGYGDDAQESVLCDVPSGFVNRGGDCDDNNAAVSPEADEYCNSVDDDCDGGVDEKAVDADEWFIDDDGDGYGRDGTSVLSCVKPDGTAAYSGDCNDRDPYASPGAAEICGDGIDNDCDGDIGACGWDSTVELKDQTRIFGNSDEDTFGRAGAVVDLDGDGQRELLLSAPDEDDYAGVLYSFDLPFSGTDLSADEASRQKWSGQGIDGLGYDTDVADIDGDGFDDLILSAFGHEYIGRGYIIYGPVTSGFTVTSSTADWSLDGGYGQFSRNNHVIGDINSDGVDDFAMGSAYSDYAGEASCGVTYIYTQASAGLKSASDGASSMIYGYDENDYLSYTMLGSDLDGDGSDELIVGAYAAHYGDGEIYLFEYETLREEISSSEADQVWVGEDPSSAGIALDAGDLDGDGIEDLLIGGYQAQDGSAYIVWGSTSVRGYALADAPIRFRGDGTTNFGYRVRIGDLNNDDVNDIIIGEGQNVPDDLFVFFGPFTGAFTIYSTDADVKLIGDPRWDEEYQLILIEEITGDGLNDLIIGSHYGGYNSQGLSYIIPGTGW